MEQHCLFLDILNIGLILKSMKKDLLEKIINFDARDFHMHTSSFSDGLNTIDELVGFATKLGFEEICITDHSDAPVL